MPGRDLKFIITIRIIHLQKNTSVSLIYVDLSSVDWGDYDNDGYLDILLTGHWGGLNDYPISKIYHNNTDGTFTENTSTSLMGMEYGSAAWGDYDADGYLDIILHGSKIPTYLSYLGYLNIYHNSGDGTFTSQTSVHTEGEWGSSVAWGDYNNDGYLDFIITGSDSRIFRNNKNNTFTEETSISFYPLGLFYGSVAWADYDNDGNLDILQTGWTGYYRVSKIYRNNNINLNVSSNLLPNAPSNLRTVVNGNHVTFSWDRSTDNETPQNGLTYNLAIGSTSGTCDILSPMADLNTGKRRIVSMGNAGECNSRTIKGLAQGQYYWSVQAIDNNFAGSLFAPEQVVTVALPVELISFKASISNNDIVLNWNTITEVNNYGFEIERKNISSDIKESNWTKIGFVNGHGNSNSTKSYGFIDKNISGGTKFNYRLKQIDNDGKYEFSKEIEIELTKEYALYQNFPNPFNPTTNIKFQIPKDGFVLLKVYDILGREVATLVNEEKKAGFYNLQFDATGLSSGIYFYKLQFGNNFATKKLIFQK